MYKNKFENIQKIVSQVSGGGGFWPFCVCDW